MCDYARKLVAWMDAELTGNEMSEMERHLAECEECRTRVAKYRKVSNAFTEYCVATEATKVRRKGMLAGAAVALAAAVVLAFVVGMILRRPRLEPVHVLVPEAAVASPVTQEAPAEAERTVLQRRAPGRTKLQHASGARREAVIPPMAPAIQIAIPAESMFPPGAVPEGINFAADVSFGPDGVARQIRLRPQLAGSEERIIQQ